MFQRERERERETDREREREGERERRWKSLKDGENNEKKQKTPEKTVKILKRQ